MHFRSTGEDDVDLRSSCKNDFEDDGDEDLGDADKEETTEQEEKEKEKEEKEEKKKEKEEGEEEEDLEYLRLNCTRMSTRRATNFSQVGFIYIFIYNPFFCENSLSTHHILFLFNILSNVLGLCNLQGPLKDF